MFGHACRMKLEGIIAKRRGSKVVAFVEKPGFRTPVCRSSKSRSNRMNWRQWSGGTGQGRTGLGAEMPCAALA